MGWFDDLMGRGQAAPAAAPPPPPPAAGGWADQIIPRTEMRSTDRAPVSRVDDPARSADIGTIGNASLLPDAEDQITLYSRQMGIPRNQFGIDRDGQIIYADPRNGGAPTRVVPSVFGGGGGVGDYAARGARWAASQVGPMIPAATSMVGSLVPNPLAGVAAAGGGAFVGDLIRQALGRTIGGMNPTEVNLPNAAGQGALGAAGQAVGSAAAGVLTRNPLGIAASDRLAAQNRGNQALWQQAMRDAQAQGINLDIAQATGLPSLRAAGRQLRRYPETMDLETARLENQQLNEIPRAYRNNLDANVGPQTTVENAVGNNPDFAPRDPAGNPLPRSGMRGAAQDIMDRAAAQRTAQASPHYQAAFGSGVVPDISPVLTDLDSMIASGRFPEGSAALRSLQSARTALTRQGVDAQGNPTRLPLDNFEGLHNAKLAMDSALGEMSRSGASRADIRVAERNMIDVQRRLTETLRQAHPEYEAGYQAYIAASPAVEAVRRDLGALANLNGIERMQVLDSVFNPANTNPEAIARMRQAFLINGRMNEWNGGLRAWMENKLTSAMAPLQSGEVPNVAGRLFRTFSDDRQLAVIRAALPQAEAANLEAFFRVLDRARRMAPEGSPTATDLMGQGSMVGADTIGRGARLAGRALSPSTLLDAGNLAAETLNAIRTPEARRQFAQAFSDPDALRTIGNLRMMNPGSEQAMRLALRFVTTYGGTGAAGTLMPPTPRAPEALARSAGQAR